MLQICQRFGKEAFLYNNVQKRAFLIGCSQQLHLEFEYLFICAYGKEGKVKLHIWELILSKEGASFIMRQMIQPGFGFGLFFKF